jgi:hypothetical protein
MEPAHAVLDVAADGQNAVVFRHDQWARPGGMPHDPAAIGLTTVFFIDTPGRLGDASILDADIELNAVSFTFTTDPSSATARPGTSIADLENTLTHELGHVQGLAHNCWDHVTATPPLDNLGNPILDCGSTLPASITMATMFPYARSGEISKRNLSSDDVQGVCEVYPPTGTPPACFLNVRSGCAVANGGARPCGNLPQALPLLLLAIAALAIARGRAPG